MYDKRDAFDRLAYFFFLLVSMLSLNGGHSRFVVCEGQRLRSVHFVSTAIKGKLRVKRSRL